MTWAGTCVATLWALLTDERGLIGPFDDAHAARASLNAALLLASGALELTLRHVLKRRQRQGYLAFYRGVRKLIPQPFRIVALGTAVLFVIVTTGWSVEAARAVATLQCAGMVGCLLAIGERIRRHNAAAPSPDARVALGRGCEDADVLSNAHGWDGSNHGGDDVEDGFVGDEASVSEEQAEFNRYLCEQVRELGRECVRLQRRLAEGKAGDARDDSGDDDDDSSMTTTRTSTMTDRRPDAGEVRHDPPSRARPPRRSSPGRARSSRGCARSWTSEGRRWRGCTRRAVSTSRSRLGCARRRMSGLRTRRGWSAGWNARNGVRREGAARWAGRGSSERVVRMCVNQSQEAKRNPREALVPPFKAKNKSTPSCASARCPEPPAITPTTRVGRPARTPARWTV